MYLCEVVLADDVRVARVQAASADMSQPALHCIGWMPKQSDARRAALQELATSKLMVLAWLDTSRTVLFAFSEPRRTFPVVPEAASSLSPQSQRSTMGEPTPDELESISAACSKLWELDENRLVEGRDYHLNLQVRPRPIFLGCRPTISTFCTGPTFFSVAVPVVPDLL